jgi:hypothetical protein
MTNPPNQARSSDRARAAPAPAISTKPLTPAEIAFMRAMFDRKESRPVAPRLAFETGKSVTHVSLDGEDKTLAAALMEAACGTDSWEFAASLLSQLMGALNRGNETNEVAINGALAALHSLAPRDELEAMLIAQMVATNAAALEHLGKAGRADYLPRAEHHGRLAAKLLHAYAAQMEALRRYRTGGQQHVRVEHVTVNAGGQAIVGAVAVGGPGGGGSPISEGQPHAP